MPPHEPRESHFDLFLQWEDKLKAWVFDRAIGDQMYLSATQNHDHRLAYLNYEGEVSGNRGHVHRVLAGIVERLQFDLNFVKVKSLSEESAYRIELEMTRTDNPTPSSHLQPGTQVVEVDRTGPLVDLWSVKVTELRRLPMPSDNE